jgi:hypothetical protein
VRGKASDLDLTGFATCKPPAFAIDDREVVVGEWAPDSAKRRTRQGRRRSSRSARGVACAIRIEFLFEALPPSPSREPSLT